MQLREVAHRALVGTDVVADRNATMRRMWNHVYRRATDRWGDQTVALTLHGRQATINFANPYPRALRRYRNYNAPQVELVSLAAEAAGSGITVVDVGAAVGDTALLLLQKCPSAISRLICVEGDGTFMSLLRSNLDDPRVVAHQVMLAASEGNVAGLVRTEHAGTASAVGDSSVAATTLDALLVDERPAVLKIDTDGFDGPILAGATKTLRSAQPAVLFEWHPKLYAKVGSDVGQPFEVLGDAGYDRFVWFTKFGQFSHFGNAEIRELARLSTSTTTLYDWHFDVVALHKSSLIDPVAVANLANWGDGGW